MCVCVVNQPDGVFSDHVSVGRGSSNSKPLLCFLITVVPQLIKVKAVSRCIEGRDVNLSVRRPSCEGGKQPRLLGSEINHLARRGTDIRSGSIR